MVPSDELDDCELELGELPLNDENVQLALSLRLNGLFDDPPHLMIDTSCTIVGLRL
jgi:hypothetical protein